MTGPTDRHKQITAPSPSARLPQISVMDYFGLPKCPIAPVCGFWYSKYGSIAARTAGSTGVVAL